MTVGRVLLRGRSAVFSFMSVGQSLRDPLGPSKAKKLCSAPLGSLRAKRKTVEAHKIHTDSGQISNASCNTVRM